jgi:hypothetical protein
LLLQLVRKREKDPMLDTSAVSSPPGRSSLLRSILSLLLVFILPVAAVLAVGPIITGSLIGGTLLWTFAYLRRARQRIQTMQTPPLPAGEEALSESGTRPATAPR